MSHYAVVVRVSGSVHLTDVRKHVEQMLAPYNEQGDEQYMEFQDKTDEIHDGWNNDSSEQIEFEGKLYFPWDRDLLKAVNASRVRAGKKPLERLGSSHPDPELDEAIKEAGGVFKEVPMNEIYDSFDEYVRRYHGYELSPTGKYGYYSNPNAKWDWYEIGGRWTGYWPTKEGTEDVGIGQPGLMTEPAAEGRADVIRIRNVDFESAQRKTEERVEKFLKEYADYYETAEEPKGSNPWGGPRHDGLNVGLVDCLDENEITDEMRAKCKLVKWDRQPDRYDVVAPLPEGEELEEFKQFLYNQFNDLRGYAYLDKNGWVEPGRMGWWASTDATPETRKEYSQSFIEWLRSGDPDDWIVAVDCHI